MFYQTLFPILNVKPLWIKMSRSASKSRADTRGPKAPVQAASPQSNDPPVEEDVVPGHLTQTQWEDLLKLEETGENVEEIVEDLMGNVMEKCLKSHIHKQVTRVL